MFIPFNLLSFYRVLHLLWISFLILIPSESFAFKGAYFLKAGEGFFGVVRTYTIRSDKETLVELALKHDLGYNEITEANPGIDPWYPGKGTRVLIPTAWVIPEVPEGLINEKRNTIVVNLSELRLFLLRKTREGLRVITFPIGIGREGFHTPTGEFSIVQKEKDPPWYVPQSIREKEPDLPAVVPPGPNNPLGRYALRLSDPLYLIHGTNQPLGIGRRVSHGCIRMYPEDIEILFNLINVGDRVLIVKQPVKIGKKGDSLYLEAHSTVGTISKAVEILLKKGYKGISTPELYQAIKQSRGIPVKIR